MGATGPKPSSTPRGVDVSLLGLAGGSAVLVGLGIAVGALVSPWMKPASAVRPAPDPPVVRHSPEPNYDLLRDPTSRAKAAATATRAVALEARTASASAARSLPAAGEAAVPRTTPDAGPSSPERPTEAPATKTGALAETTPDRTAQPERSKPPEQRTQLAAATEQQERQKPGDRPKPTDRPKEPVRAERSPAQPQRATQPATDAAPLRGSAAAEAERVLLAIDALKRAPDRDLAARVRVLAGITCTDARAASARDRCTGAYQNIAEGIERVDRLSRELARRESQGGGSDTAEIKAELERAERSAESARRGVLACEASVARLRAAYGR